MPIVNPFAGPVPSEAQPQAQAPARGGLVARFRAGLKRTHDRITGGLRAVLAVGRKLDDETVTQVEEQLYLADVGPRTAVRLCEELRALYKAGKISETQEVIPFLKERMKEDLLRWDVGLHFPQEGPGVILVAGVNGSGKTTSIGKMAHAFSRSGNKVLLAACDTFRAAAAEQLTIWSKWSGADIVRNESADPAAVAFDAAEKALKSGYDVLILDTAGRVHTRQNLMAELQKINRVVAGKIPGAPHETLMVLDATTGQNGISQALKFNEAIALTGIVLAKLDGTAKGGIVLGMQDQINIPVKLVGIGQQPEDIAIFQADKFIDALFE